MALILVRMEENTAAEDVQTNQSDTPAESQAQSLVALEKLIINYLNDIERATGQMRKQREMLDNILMNDEAYQEAHKKAKAAAKEKSTVKANLLHHPEAAVIGDKLADMKKDLAEKKKTFSNHLQEYSRLAGTNQFEDDQGQVREIVYVARVVKRSNKFRT